MSDWQRERESEWVRAVKDGDTNNHKFIKYSIGLVEKEGKEIQTLSLACVGGKYEISKNLLIYYCLYFQFNLREMIFFLIYFLFRNTILGCSSARRRRGVGKTF